MRRPPATGVSGSPQKRVRGEAEKFNAGRILRRRERAGTSSGKARSLLKSAGTVGTDAVAEADVGVFAEVFLDALPVVAVVAVILAPAADRQQPLEVAVAAAGGLQLPDALGKAGMEFDHAAGGANPSLEFGRLDGLGQILVGAALQAGDDVLQAAAAGQHDQVGRLIGGRLADAAADFQAIDAWQAPVDDGQARRVGAAQDVPGRLAVGDADDGVAPRAELFLQGGAGDGVVFRHQHAPPWRNNSARGAT